VARANYMAAADRKNQIAEVTVELVARYGVQATTVSRIAERAGVSESALYRHFESRHDILLAALDLVFDLISDFFASSESESVPERLRDIGQYHSRLVGSGEASLFYAFFEFVATPPELGLRDDMAERQSAIVALLAGIIEEGVRQGSIRVDVDPTLVAWEFHGIFFSEAITHLMGIGSFIADGLSKTLYERIIERISVS